jgi:hypothetical protein
MPWKKPPHVVSVTAHTSVAEALRVMPVLK